MSDILVDNLTGKTTNYTIEVFAGQATSSTTRTNLEQGLAKWWVSLQQETTHQIHDSFNVSSASDDGTGTSTLTFTNYMNNGDYCATMGQADGAGFNDLRSLNQDSTQTYTTSQFSFYGVSGTSLNDYLRCWLTGMGDLA